MPCMGPYTDRELRDQGAEENDKLTRMLCAVCKNLDKKDKKAIGKVRGPELYPLSYGGYVSSMQKKPTRSVSGM